MRSTMSQKAVDELIRKTIGPKRAVEARLFKSRTSPKWARYQMYGLDKGVVYVNLDKGTARVMDGKSHCAMEWAISCCDEVPLESPVKVSEGRARGGRGAPHVAPLQEARFSKRCGVA